VINYDLENQRRTLEYIRKTIRASLTELISKPVDLERSKKIVEKELLRWADMTKAKVSNMRWEGNELHYTVSLPLIGYECWEKAQ
jgi:hypothetical protein